MRPLSTMALLFLTACSPWASAPPAAQPMVITSYAVPAGTGERVARMLGELFAQGSATEAAFGRVDVAPDGSVVVLASSSVQAGVADLLGHVTEAAPPKNVSVDYWIVLGHAGAASHGAGLEAVGPALDAIEKTSGPRSFELAGHQTVLSLDAERAELTDSQGRSFEQTVSVLAAGAMLADVAIDARADHRDDIRTRLRLDPGVPIVLAQAEDAGTVRYYVVSAVSR